VQVKIKLDNQTSQMAKIFITTNLTSGICWSDMYFSMPFCDKYKLIVSLLFFYRLFLLTFESKNC